LAVAAWVMADNDLKEMNRGYMDPSGCDLTNVGRILGMVATVLMAIPLVFGILILIVSIIARKG